MDVEAMKLHEQGVQIVTLYCPPPREVYGYFERRLQAIFDFTRLQYRRIASAPEFFFELTYFDPQAAATRAAFYDSWINRGSALGELLQTERIAKAPLKAPFRYVPPALDVPSRRISDPVALQTLALETPVSPPLEPPPRPTPAEPLPAESAVGSESISTIDAPPAPTEEASTGEIQWT